MTIFIHPYDEKRLFMASSLILVSVMLLFSKNTLVNAIHQYSSLTISVKAAIWGLFGLGLLSATLSPSPSNAFLEVSSFFLLATLSTYLSERYYQHRGKFNEYLLSVFVIAATLILSVFLVQLYHVLSGNLTANFTHLFPNFSQPRFLNQWQGTAIPLIIAAALIYRKESPRASLFIFGVSAFLWLAIFVSGGRGVIIGLATGIFLSGLILKKIRFAWWKFNLIVFVSGVLLYLLLIGILYISTGSLLSDNLGLSRILTNDSSSGRFAIWSHALQLFWQSPIFGIGPMHFAFENYFNHVPGHPHNFIIQFLTEWGLPATMALLFMLIYAALKWVRFCRSDPFNDQENKILVIAVTTSFIACNTHALFSGVWVMPLSQITLFLLAGWMLGLYKSPQNHFKSATKPSPTSTAVSKKQLLIARLILACMLFAFIYGIVPDLCSYTPRLEQGFYLTDIPVFWPRFWIQGSIFNF
ncbi:O-antigen ligase family protein [Thiomicrorhabdus sp. zzn3]|uniref:O-antigen ligase family protein n=1 Tax=Thiomicrorhabdus sp. zzn3 TaxID=3039775 RepID=UPI002436F5EA|nr:O-antigen ligase family protein [Thiomicrorhabdus sp. zzn3]MDG6779051.1 O-antigen ligase family protein [Thiomicrorhabdus sp. zzn3]